MNRTFVYRIGDKVQAYDGRIGVIINSEIVADNPKLPIYQIVRVRFPDLSTMNGSPERFKVILES